MRPALSILVMAVAIALVSASAGAQDFSFGPRGAPEGRHRMQMHWIPVYIDGQRRESALALRTCRPPESSMPGDTAAPAMVLNHGSPANADQRPGIKPTSCDAEAVQWFLGRGYVVGIPLRRGYGETGGAWAEEYGSCARPNFVRGGLATADDIDAAVRYLTTLPYVQAGRTLIVGQSAGGWGSLAYSSRNPPGIAGLINFAGGRGGWAEKKPNTNCAPDLLIESAGTFGRTARLPTLWIYTQNDTFFAPAMSQAMHARYVSAGGKADYKLLPPHGQDGHGLLFARASAAVWGPLVEAYLAGLKP
ncbi:prolyl oligopeptidase family serine peptidase [Ferrovibrio terrae]|uniref:alpha/beta hydrolase family protein n=1 Tax=Ferrovibrio terrae TaxID=2594003 RepID=UPI003138207B